MNITLFLILTFILIARPQDYITSLESMRIALVLLVLVTFMGVLNRKISFSDIKNQKEARLYFIFFFLMIIGIPLAFHRRFAFVYIFFIYSSNVLYYLLLLSFIDSVDKLKMLYSAIMVSGLFSSLFYLITGSFVSGRFYSEGNMYDPNDIAYVYVSIIPIAFYCLHNKRIIMKVLAGFSLLLMIGIILISGSRGGILGMFVIILCFAIFFRKNLKLSNIFGFIAIIFIALVLYEKNINLSRYMTLTDLSSDYNITDYSGRLFIWKHAFDIFLLNPITGVGVSCFPMALGYYRADLNLLPRWLNTHNSFIQVMVEVGFIGFILYSYLIYVSLKNINSLRKNRNIDQDLKNISAAMLIAFIGNLCTGFFLSQAYSLFFTIFIGFSTVLNKITNYAIESAPICNKQAL